MASFNQVILLGNLGADPEMKTLKSGALLASLSLATTRKYKNSAGEDIEETEWHRVKLFRQTAEVAQKYLHKGSCVFIQGFLRTEKWTDRDGNEKSTLVIIGQSMQMIREGQPKSQAQGQAYQPRPRNRSADFEETPF